MANDINEDRAGFIDHEITRVFNKGEGLGFYDMDLHFEALERVLCEFSCVSLVSVLDTILEHKGFDEDELKFVKEARDKIVASDDIYRGR